MTAGAPWCTLCLTPRPAPAPVPAAMAASTAAHYPTVTRAPAAVDGPSPAADAPVEARTWPCHRCHEAIPMDLDICPACGAAFLGGSGELPVLSLPLVGDMTGRSTTATYAIAAGIGVGLALLAVSVVAVIGLIF